MQLLHPETQQSLFNRAKELHLEIEKADKAEDRNRYGDMLQKLTGFYEAVEVTFGAQATNDIFRDAYTAAFEEFFGKRDDE